MAKSDFFISYNRNDKKWAEWIAWQLENAGYTTVIQAWDFRPGGNFVTDMQKATTSSERTIAILSPDYLASRFTQPEWNAAFALDPAGEKGLLLPIKVRDCQLTGLLPQIVYIDLTGLSADEAVETLLVGVKRGRVKPLIPPNFPGTVDRAEPEFPKQASMTILSEASSPVNHQAISAMYDLATINDLLITAFSDEAITTLVFEKFRSFYDELGSGMGKREKVRRLVEWCDNNLKIDVLLKEVQRRNPAQFRRWELRSGPTTSNQLSNEH